MVFGPCLGVTLAAEVKFGCGETHQSHGWDHSTGHIYIVIYIYIYVFFSYFWDISVCIYSNAQNIPKAATLPRVFGLHRDVVNVMLKENIPIGTKGIWDEKVSPYT